MHFSCYCLSSAYYIIWALLTQKLDKFELRLEQNTIDQEKISGQCTLGGNAFFFSAKKRRQGTNGLWSDEQAILFPSKSIKTTSVNTWTSQRAGKSLCVQSRKPIITQKTITYSINDYGQNKNNDEYSAHIYNQAYHEFFKTQSSIFLFTDV